MKDQTLFEVLQSLCPKFYGQCGVWLLLGKDIFRFGNPGDIHFTLEPNPSDVSHKAPENRTAYSWAYKCRSFLDLFIQQSMKYIFQDAVCQTQRSQVLNWKFGL